MCTRYDCPGPCYDLCMCSHCWNGWKTVPFSRRLFYRAEQIWFEFKQKFHALWHK